MFILSIRFLIPRPAARLLLTGADGNVDLNKVEAYYDKGLLEELRDFPGLKWKLWAISKNGLHGSGFYLFGDEGSAELRARYANKYYWRKGMFFCRCHISEVIEGCSRFTRAPIDIEANPPVTSEQAEDIMNLKSKLSIRKLYEKYKLLKGME